MTGPELWDHADQLASGLGSVDVNICDDCDWPELYGKAVIDSGKAVVYLSHAPTSSAAYLLYLHELGHLAIQRGKRGFRAYGLRPRLRDEAMAWRWALKKSAITPSCEDWFQILYRLVSYEIDRRYKRDHVFDRLLLEAERNACVRSNQPDGDA